MTGRGMTADRVRFGLRRREGESQPGCSGPLGKRTCEQDEREGRQADDTAGAARAVSADLPFCAALPTYVNHEFLPLLRALASRRLLGPRRGVIPAARLAIGRLDPRSVRRTRAPAWSAF